MSDPRVRFSDGASYDAMMGPWSRSAGSVLLDWVHPESGLEWIDVGCGSGAFTELIVERCAPASILGIDPSEPQLEYARDRLSGGVARFERADAMALPLKDSSVDVAAAALVVHFMPDPAQGVAEMTRVTRQGGLVTAYAWDLLGGGFPYAALNEQMRALGYPPPEPPHPEAAEAGEMRRLWSSAGLEGVQERSIEVTRSFRDFEEYWAVAITSPRTKLALDQMPMPVVVDLKKRVMSVLPVADNGAVVPVARANAIWGMVP